MRTFLLFPLVFVASFGSWERELQAQSSSRRVESTLATLYETFSFDRGQEPDWTRMRALFLDGATFVAPVTKGTPPHGVNAEQFVRDFREWVLTSADAKAGFRERIVHMRIDRFGHLAHAYVTFEGFVPGEVKARKRGIDSIQLVLDNDRWKVASFTTQYESPGLVMPSRFLSSPQ